MSEELHPEADEEPEEDDEARNSGADATLFTATTGTKARPDGGRGNRKIARTAGARPSSQSLSGENHEHIDRVEDAHEREAHDSDPVSGPGCT